MKRFHRWGYRGTASLKTVRGRRCTVTFGVEEECLHIGCYALRRRTYAGSSVTYSTDAGETWGPIGGKAPACEALR